MKNIEKTKRWRDSIKGNLRKRSRYKRKKYYPMFSRRSAYET